MGNAIAKIIFKNGNESLETKYWLSLLKDTDYIDLKVYESIFQDVDEIVKILFAILKKTRIN